MNTTPENQQKKHICAALLAHVDAGKTTLSEALLYESGVIRTRGRVDHKDAFLDTSPLERERGITIFSKQACFSYGNMDVPMLDTPGHVYFCFDHKRNRRRAGAYGDCVETFAEISDSDIFLCQ